MTPEIITTEPHWLQIAAWLAQIALGAAAICALAYAAHEVHALRDANRQTAKQAKATFLLHLDTRWAHLMGARRRVDGIRRRIHKSVTNAHPLKDDPGLEPALRRAFADEFGNLQRELDKEDGDDSYRSVIELCGFLEIVGLMVKRDYVPLEDVSGALKGPLFSFDQMFGEHIRDREQEKGTPKGLFEHALYLCGETKRLYPNG